MEEKSTPKEISLRHLLVLALTNKKRIALNLGIAFVLACAYILCIPRYYRAEVRMAPETVNVGSLNSLTSLASSFGIDMAGTDKDAISPDLYPDLFESNDFLVGLMDIQVTTEDQRVTTDFYTYLKNHREGTPWAPAFRALRRMLKPKPKPRPNIGRAEKEGLDVFLLSEEDFSLLEEVKSNITCHIDKKTDIIVITVQDQDRLICATMADSVRVHLQEFITDYRTSKARVDVDYYRSLCQQAEAEYSNAVTEYGRYADAHQNVILQTYISRRDELEYEMQVKQNTLNALRQQLQTAEAKVQERTPAFTVIQGATVPVKAAGPKRMIFVGGVLFLVFCGTLAWLYHQSQHRE